jgi:hypothetical protein
VIYLNQIYNLHDFFFPVLPINLWHKADANCCLCTVVSDVHVIYRIHDERRYNPSMLNAQHGRHALKLPTEDDHYDDDDDDDDDDKQRRRQKFQDINIEAGF